MKEKSDRCIAVAGGGTGGHIIPAVAVIDELRKNWNGSVVWISSKYEIDDMLINSLNLKRYKIFSGKLRRYFSLYNLIDMFRIIIGIIQSVFILAKVKPLLLFSKGGFVSVPPVLASAMLKIPVITHESDINPGLATRINSVFAEKILVSFKETEGFMPKRYRDKIIVTGNPVREGIDRGDAEKGKKIVGCPRGKKMILILGGSQGAAGINNLIMEILKELTERYFVVHQTGKNATKSVEFSNYRSFSFIDSEMPHLLAAADLIISRAGANALWEFSVCSKAVILIPLPRSGSRGDQLLNAEYLARHDAAVVLDQEKTTGSELLETIENLFNNNERLKELGSNLNRLLPGNASKAITRILLERLKRGG